PAFTGRFHLSVETDAGNQVFENGNKADDTAEPPSLLDAMPIPYADLTISQLTSDASGQSGKPLHVAWRLTYQGIGRTSESAWNDAVTLTSDPAGQHVVTTLGFYTYIGLLNPTDFYDASLDARLPDGLSGTFYVAVQTNLGNSAFEFVHTDNNLRVTGPIS